MTKSPKPVPSTVTEPISSPTSSPSRISAAKLLKMPPETRMKGRMSARLSPRSMTGSRFPRIMAAMITMKAVPTTGPSMPKPR